MIFTVQDGVSWILEQLTSFIDIWKDKLAIFKYNINFLHLKTVSHLFWLIQEFSNNLWVLYPGSTHPERRCSWTGEIPLLTYCWGKRPYLSIYIVTTSILSNLYPNFKTKILKYNNHTFKTRASYRKGYTPSKYFFIAKSGQICHINF